VGGGVHVGALASSLSIAGAGGELVRGALAGSVRMRVPGWPAPSRHPWSGSAPGPSPRSSVRARTRQPWRKPQATPGSAVRRIGRPRSPPRSRQRPCNATGSAASCPPQGSPRRRSGSPSLGAPGPAARAGRPAHPGSRGRWPVRVNERSLRRVNRTGHRATYTPPSPPTSATASPSDQTGRLWAQLRSPHPAPRIRCRRAGRRVLPP
jgi:hypothetical protein